MSRSEKWGHGSQPRLRYMFVVEENALQYSTRNTLQYSITLQPIERLGRSHACRSIVHHFIARA